MNKITVHIILQRVGNNLYNLVPMRFPSNDMKKLTLVLYD